MHLPPKNRWTGARMASFSTCSYDSKVACKRRARSRTFGFVRYQMKLGDIVRFGSNAEVLQNLRSIHQLLSDAALDIQIRDKDDYLRFALNGLIHYASIQVLRFIDFYEKEIESQAWAARNLFEIYLLCVYIIQDESRARQFVSQKAVDELQINEGFMSLCRNSNDPSLPHVRERNERIKRALEKHSMDVSLRPWSVKFLAEKTENQVEYEAFFKLYSKYVHPSAWVILGDPTETDTPTLNNVFLVQAQFYAEMILKIAQDVAGHATTQEDPYEAEHVVGPERE